MRQGSRVGFFRLAAALRLDAVMSKLASASSVGIAAKIGLPGLIGLISLIGLATLTGCSGFFTAITSNPVGNGTSTYVYATNAGGTLTEYSLTSGVLAPLSGSPVTLPVAPTSIVVAPNNAFVYIGTGSGGIGSGVFLYTINSNGTLTEGNGNNVAYLNPSGLVVQSMVIDPTSSWLIMSYENSTEVDALQLEPTTGLPTSTVPFSITTTFAAPAPQLAISPANTQVFVTLGTGGTEAVGFNPSGTGTNGPWGGPVSIKLLSNGGTSDTGVAVDPTSTYLFVAEQFSNSSGAIAGKVRMIATASLQTDLNDYPTGIGPSAVLADLSGAYVYVTNGTDGTISGFSLNKTNQTLTSLGATFPTEQSPVAIVEDSTKAYVMDVGNLANPNLWLYSFDSTSLGSLDVGSTTSTGTTNPSVANGIAVTH